MNNWIKAGRRIGKTWRTFDAFKEHLLEDAYRDYFGEETTGPRFASLFAFRMLDGWVETHTIEVDPGMGTSVPWN